jgi:AcrR family transcriptional regulator
VLDESRFMGVNLDSSRARARRAKPVRSAARTRLQSQMRRTVRETMRETVRVAILDAAEELIAEHGLHDAALVQIAKRAGVAVGTLYNYFTDRDALIRGLFESRRTTLRPKLLAAINAGADLAFEPRLRLFMHELLAAFESHRGFLKVALEKEHLKPPGSTTAQDLLGGVVDLIAAGVREGAIAAGTAKILPLVITGAIKAIIVQRLQDGSELTGDAAALVAILLDGVRSAAP